MPLDPKLWAACFRVEEVAEGKAINHVYNKSPFTALDNFKADLKLVVDAARKAG
jgi:hypothetical protein